MFSTEKAAVQSIKNIITGSSQETENIAR